MIRCAIDISHNNGPIKWSLVPDTIKCVMIKATQGRSFVDPAFNKNFEGAIDTGRLVIPYHFLDNAPVANQFTNFQHAIDLRPGMVVAVDWETVSRTQKRAPAIVMEQFGAMCQAATGRAPLAYHGMYDLSSPKINAWPWWVPKYGPEPTKIKWLFWQFTSRERMKGFSGPVDCSMFIGNEAELYAWFERNTLPRGF